MWQTRISSALCCVWQQRSWWLKVNLCRFCMCQDSSRDPHKRGRDSQPNEVIACLFFWSLQSQDLAQGVRWTHGTRQRSLASQVWGIQNIKTHVQLYHRFLLDHRCHLPLHSPFCGDSCATFASFPNSLRLSTLICREEGRADTTPSTKQRLAGAGNQLSDGCYRNAHK